MTVSNRIVRTTHADIAIAETGGDGMPVLFIHGNSNCKEALRKQYEGAIGEKYRVIAMDLPGHGASGDAHDPSLTYTMPGYAETAVEVLRELGISKAAVFGWSLGGHVALEMIPRFPGLVGAMITGTPPVGLSQEEIFAGFRMSPAIPLVGQAELTDEEREIFIAATCGTPADPAMRQAVERADGRARAVMFGSLLTGQASDQRKLVETSEVPVAVVNGADDQIVNVEYINSVSYRALWDDHCYVLRGVGHTPFFEMPDAFNAILIRFLDDMARRAKDLPDKPSRTAAA